MKGYFTVDGVAAASPGDIAVRVAYSSHSGQVRQWQGLAEGDMPGLRRMHNIDPAHAFRTLRDNSGIWMQWKQWTTDEAWSKPVQVLSAPEVVRVRQWRPAEDNMEFPSGGQPMLDWLERLEAWCAAQPARSVHLALHHEFTWLRAAIHHTVPGAYAPSTCVDDTVRDLRALPRTRPKGLCSKANVSRAYAIHDCAYVAWSGCA